MNNVEEQSTDNGWHPLRHPSYVEWWYLDAIFQTGDVLSGSLGLWGDLRRPAEVTVRSDFFMRRPTGDLLDFGRVVTLDHFLASTTRCDVGLGSQRLFESDGRFLLFLTDLEGDTVLDLEYTPLFPGFAYRYELDEPDRAFWWAVPAPWATVKGTLQKSGRTVSLNGTGYHDHNWASISITHRFGGWDWWRLHYRSGAVVFARVLAPNGGVLFQLLYWVDADTGKTRMMTDQDTGFLIADDRRSWRVQSGDGGFSLELTLSRTECLVYRSADHHYGRFHSRGTGMIGQENDRQLFTGSVLHESQRFRRGNLTYENPAS